MKTLTDKEVVILAAFANESLDCCGQFNDDDNMSWNNAQDLILVTGYNAQVVGGLMASLLDKELIADYGESARGAPINDFYAIPDNYLKYPQIAHFVN